MPNDPKSTAIGTLPEVVIDASVLAKLERYGGKAFVRRMIVQVLVTAGQRLESVRAGILSGDGLEVARAAHSLKGSAAIIGARSLQYLARDLEQHAMVHDAAKVARSAAAVEQAYELARDALLERRHEGVK